MVDRHFKAYRKARAIFYFQLVYSSFVYSERFKMHSYPPVSVLLILWQYPKKVMERFIILARSNIKRMFKNQKRLQENLLVFATLTCILLLTLVRYSYKFVYVFLKYDCLIKVECDSTSSAKYF